MHGNMCRLCVMGMEMIKDLKGMNKYICLINEMYNNNIRLHTPLQNIDCTMPTSLLEILSVSDGIEEIISIGDRKESIGWILYSYDMIKNNTEFYTAEYGISGYIFSDDGAGNMFVMKDDESIYLFNAIDGEEEYFAESLAEFWDINSDVSSNSLSNEERADNLVKKYGFDFAKIKKREIKDLLEKEINNYQEGSSEYIRVLCGYLFCIGNYEDVLLIERAKYSINFDVGCMIDGAWIEALKGNMAEEDKQFHIQAFIKQYENV